MGDLFGWGSASKQWYPLRRYVLPFPRLSEYMGREDSKIPWGVPNVLAATPDETGSSPAASSQPSSQD